MEVMPDRDVERALAVVAHPDDVEFWAGGTVARWVDAGVAMTYCVLTDGGAGGFDDTVPRAAIPEMRRAEQTAAAEVLGVPDVRFLGRSEDELSPSEELRRELVRIIREVRPRRVLTWSPQPVRPGEPHPRTAGRLAG